MRIAQVSPLYESVPPGGYGGTERVVSNLTEGLVERGHDVTLFASGDSKTAANLVACSPSALRLSNVRDSLTYHLCMLDEVLARADEFDVIHSHVDYLGYPFFERCAVPNVTTLHGRLDLDDLRPVFERFGRMPLVSISDAQRKPFPSANWTATVYHGLPPGEFAFQPEPERYLCFLGRVSPEKRVDRAIEIAKRVDLPLRVAAKIDAADRDYYKAEIEPLLGDPHVEFIGEIGGKEKVEFLGNALAMLFPIDWPEPFGLVMIEAMACGTPVIAYPRGSVPEVITDGVTGFIVDSIDEAVRAVERVEQIDRFGCRSLFEERFSVATMVDNYIDVYESVIAAASRPVIAAASRPRVRRSGT